MKKSVKNKADKYAGFLIRSNNANYRDSKENLGEETAMARAFRLGGIQVDLFEK